MYEAETEEQLINLTVHWFPEVKMKWVPLLEGPKVGKVWAEVKG